MRWGWWWAAGLFCEIAGILFMAGRATPEPLMLAGAGLLALGALTIIGGEVHDRRLRPDGGAPKLP